MESKASVCAHAACERAHSERNFEFLAEGPMSEVAPLFGAHKERLWAPGWDPCFIWPARAEDRPGMVFTVSGQHGTAVWVNTRFEPQDGHVQYAYVLENTMSTLITLLITPRGECTHVAVSYRRTALKPQADPWVAHMAELDTKAGDEWAAQINAYLKAR
ncbi:MAG: hypothetical protein ABSG30_07160 [Steroidobacteraceae bacterium]